MKLKCIFIALITLCPLVSEAETLPPGDLTALQQPGEHLLTETAVFPVTSGGKFIGAGQGAYWKNVAGKNTHLINDGLTGPMIDFRGGEWLMSDFTLQGLKKLNPNTYADQRKPSAGIQVLPSGAGTGDNTIERVTFANQKIGIQLGEKLEDNRCDMTILRGPARFIDCEICLQQNNQMAMSNAIEHYTISNTQSKCYVADIQAGGNFSMRGIQITYAKHPITLIRTGVQRTKETLSSKGVMTKYHAFGASNGWFFIDGLKIDRQVGSNLVLIEKQNDIPQTYYLRNLQISPSSHTENGKLLVMVKGPCTIIVDGGLNVLQRHTLWAVGPDVSFLAYGASFGDMAEMSDVLHPNSEAVRFYTRACKAYDNSMYSTAGVWFKSEYRTLDGQGKEYR